MKQTEIQRLESIIYQLKEAINNFKSRKDKSIIKKIIEDLEHKLAELKGETK